MKIKMRMIGDTEKEYSKDDAKNDEGSSISQSVVSDGTEAATGSSGEGGLSTSASAAASATAAASFTASASASALASATASATASGTASGTASASNIEVNASTDAVSNPKDQASSSNGDCSGGEVPAEGETFDANGTTCGDAIQEVEAVILSDHDEGVDDELEDGEVTSAAAAGQIDFSREELNEVGFSMDTNNQGPLHCIFRKFDRSRFNTDLVLDFFQRKDGCFPEGQEDECTDYT